ncbi:MAG: TlpA family protein disulfide reductase [Candidatus Hodarchaeota archaeon]
MGTSGKKIIVKSWSYDDPISYITNIDIAQYQVKFSEKLSTSRIRPDIASKLGQVVLENKLKFLVFSADWCKDSQEVLPLLAKIYQVTKIPMKILGGIKKNLNPPPSWKVPPSPPEVLEYNVEKLPCILVLDKGSCEIARVYEQPPPGKSLEKHLLEVIEEYLDIEEK